ncbi:MULTISPECIES: hypothetical protein [Pseudomonas]|uniref:hypothetical protein n=1 Tax=Pseudomonas TaxID=286 RepID=UPI001BEB8866|nr:MULTISPECIES: hypothetical protein [Pseudomonas]MBT2341684.1 hypothetical protein [Pseudomonas fluorescens]MCD4531743.1 hypothetical protein [Pseudomonas sp. C3-2018]
MKHTAFAGLFISAVMLASPVFATSQDSQDDLCQINLDKIRNANVSTEQKSESLQADIDAKVSQAKGEQAKGTKEGTQKCISLTTQVLQKLQNNVKGDPQ